MTEEENGSVVSRNERSYVYYVIVYIAQQHTRLYIAYTYGAGMSLATKLSCDDYAIMHACPTPPGCQG